MELRGEFCEEDSNYIRDLLERKGVPLDDKMSEILNLEPIGVIVLVFMIVLLLFQKKIFLFFKRAYEHSKNRWHTLLIVYLGITLFLILFITFYDPSLSSYDPSFIGSSLVFFIIMFFGKITILIEDHEAGNSGIIMIVGFMFFIDWLRNVYLHEGPTLIDMLIIAVFSINWLDFTVRLSRDIRRLRKVGQEG